MAWRELPPLRTDVSSRLPRFERIRLVAGPVTDHRAALAVEERTAVATAQPRRAWQFATGRYLARLAMADLGLPAAPIGRAEDRSPLWPDGVTGSITHTGDLAVAAVAAPGAAAGIGIDLERVDRISERVLPRILTAGERSALEAMDPRTAAVTFSAKEAGYKAVYPSCRRFIGFQEASVETCWSGGTLRLRYLGDHEPNRMMEAGTGHFCFFGPYVLTVFIIPSQSSPR